MNKRELWLMGLLSVVLFTITAWVCIDQWGYGGLKLFSNLTSAVINLGILVFALHMAVKLKRQKDQSEVVPHIKSVLTFWQLEYERYPIMVKGNPIQIDPKLLLLTLTSDRPYVDRNKLPDFPDYDICRYYTLAYLRIVNCVGLPKNMSVREFTVQVAKYLQGLTKNPVKTQTGHGLANLIGEK